MKKFPCPILNRRGRGFGDIIISVCRKASSMSLDRLNLQVSTGSRIPAHLVLGQVNRDLIMGVACEHGSRQKGTEGYIERWCFDKIMRWIFGCADSHDRDRGQ